MGCRGECAWFSDYTGYCLIMRQVIEESKACLSYRKRDEPHEYTDEGGEVRGL